MKKPNANDLIKRGNLKDLVEPVLENEASDTKPTELGLVIPTLGFKANASVKQKPYKKSRPITPKFEGIAKLDVIKIACDLLGEHPSYREVLEKLKRQLDRRWSHTQNGKIDPETGETLREKKYRQAEELILAVVGCILMQKRRSQRCAVSMRVNSDAELNYFDNFVKLFEGVFILEMVKVEVQGTSCRAYSIDPNGNLQFWQEQIQPLLDLENAIEA